MTTRKAAPAAKKPAAKKPAAKKPAAKKPAEKKPAPKQEPDKVDPEPAQSAGMKAHLPSSDAKIDSKEKGPRKPKIDVGVDDNGTSTTFTAKGFGTGGHAATLRLLGDGTLDDSYDLSWDGDAVETTVDKTDYVHGVLTVNDDEYRFDVKELA